MKLLAPYEVGPKQNTVAPYPPAPADAEAPDLPVEANTSAPERIREPTPSASRAPYQILKWADDRPPTRHWGINE